MYILKPPYTIELYFEALLYAFTIFCRAIRPKSLATLCE